MHALGIAATRQHIDDIDGEIIRLLAKRVRAAVDIGHEKSRRGLPVHSPGREAQVIGAVREAADHANVNPDEVAALYQEILRRSASVQDQVASAG